MWQIACHTKVPAVPTRRTYGNSAVSYHILTASPNFLLIIFSQLTRARVRHQQFHFPYFFGIYNKSGTTGILWQDLKAHPVPVLIFQNHPGGVPDLGNSESSSRSRPKTGLFSSLLNSDKNMRLFEKIVVFVWRIKPGCSSEKSVRKFSQILKFKTLDNPMCEKAKNFRTKVFTGPTFVVQVREKKIKTKRFLVQHWWLNQILCFLKFQFLVFLEFLSENYRSFKVLSEHLYRVGQLSTRFALIRLTYFSLKCKQM